MKAHIQSFFCYGFIYNLLSIIKIFSFKSRKISLKHGFNKDDHLILIEIMKRKKSIFVDSKETERIEARAHGVTCQKNMP